MKSKIIVLLVVLLVSKSAELRSQEVAKTLSNAEKFSAAAGQLLQIEFIELGEVKKAQFKILRYENILTQEKRTALRIQKDVTTSYGTDSKIATLDTDELDGLLKSINIIMDKARSEAPENYTEVKYSSRAGFEAGCYYNQSKSKWSAYMKLEKYSSESYVFLDIEDLKIITDLLEKAGNYFN